MDINRRIIKWDTMIYVFYIETHVPVKATEENLDLESKKREQLEEGMDVE